MKCLALDFGGSSVKYGVVSEDAKILLSGKEPAPLDSVDSFVATTADLFKSVGKECEGIAISLPGYVNPETGFLAEAGAYQKLYGKCIPDLIHTKIDVPVYVMNDGKCAALAELWNGSIKGCKDAAVVILGSGIAGGIIHGGKLVTGKDDAAGELSYILTTEEDYSIMSMAHMSAAMTGLCYRICKAKNIDIKIQDNAEVLSWIDNKAQIPYAHPDEELIAIRVDGVQLFNWVEEDDPDVMKIYRKFINALAMVVHNVQICDAPEKIAIGGGLSFDDRLFADLRDELKRYYEGCELGEKIQANIVRTHYKNECNVIGAAYNFFQRNQIKQ